MIELEKPKKTIQLLDTFCGAGGSSTGAVFAIEELGHRPALTCVNHNKMAIATHTVNHPWARHYCTGVDDLNLNSMYGNTLLDILWSSPSCVSHSQAKGGTPINEQDRATGWCVVRIAETLRPPIILIENVKAFLKWGPCERRWSKKESRWELHPDKKREGETFNAWLSALTSLGYRVEWKILCCADYGDPTTRERLFVQCVSGRLKNVWPTATHYNPKKPDLFTKGKVPWIPARDIIDWALPSQSIFLRKKPLVAKTLRRIFIGLDKIGLEETPGKDYLVRQMGQSCAERIENPLSTVVGGPKHYLSRPYLAKLRGNNTAVPIENPTPTITAGGTHLALVELQLDALLPQQSAGILREAGDPSPTVSTAGAISLIQAKATKITKETGPAAEDSVHVQEEAQKSTTGLKEFAFAQPMLVQLNHVDANENGSGRIKSTAETFTTVCGNRGEWSLCESYLIPNFGENGNQEPRTHSIDAPLPTTTSHGAGGLTTPALIPEGDAPASEELPPVHKEIRKLVDDVLKKLPPTKNFHYFGEWHPCGRPVIEVQGERYILDILFRMLQPHELSAAQGFPKNYQFEGTKTEIIKQIGNAVPCNTARALVKAALTQQSEVGLPEYEWLQEEKSLTFSLMESHGGRKPQAA